MFFWYAYSVFFTLVKMYKSIIQKMIHFYIPFKSNERIKDFLYLFMYIQINRLTYFIESFDALCYLAAKTLSLMNNMKGRAILRRCINFLYKWSVFLFFFCLCRRGILWGMPKNKVIISFLFYKFNLFF